MTHTDSFIEEVTEEVRRDRLFNLFRKYGWIGILTVVLIVGAASWREWRVAQDRAAAQAFGDAVLAAQAIEDPAARRAALEKITATGPSAAVLGFLEAAAAEAAGDRAGAIARLEAIRSDAALGPAYRDLAALKRLLLEGTAMPADTRKALLDEIAKPGRPYRTLALEQIALDKAAAGDRAGAIADYNALLQEPDVTARLHQRATQMILALGGTPGAN